MRRLLALVLILPLHTHAAGGASVGLSARIVDVTCPLNMVGTSSGSLDLGTYSVQKSGTASVLKPVLAQGQTQTTTVQVTTVSDCSAKGALMLAVSGYNDNADGKSSTATSDVYEYAAAKTVGCLTAAVEGNATPYCLPYAFGIKGENFSLGVNNVSTSVSQFIGDACSLSIYAPGTSIGQLTMGACYISSMLDTASLTRWSSPSMRKTIVLHTLIKNPGQSTPCNPVSILSSSCQWVGGSTSIATTGPTAPFDVSALNMQLVFSIPQKTTRWGDTPPPTGTEFTGQLVFTSSYL